MLFLQPCLPVEHHVDGRCRRAARNLQHLMPRRPWNLVLIASNLARVNYRPQPVDVQVDFFRAQTAPDPAPTPWEGLAGRGVVLHQIVAPKIDHVGIMHDGGARLLAEELAQALEANANDAGANGHANGNGAASTNGHGAGANGAAAAEAVAASV